jgi:hypothetical protein
MPSDDDRRAALSEFARLSGFDFDVFDRLFPTRPWAEVVPPELWYRREVLEQRDERERLLLYRALEDLVGTTHASTVMAYLPPVPWQVLARYGIDPPTRSAA